LEERIAKVVKVLNRIKDYFLEAIEKYNNTIQEASKTLTESLKRIEKDLKTIEIGKLPPSETVTSAAVITSILAKRGEIMTPQELWAVLHGQPIVREEVPAPPAVEEPSVAKEIVKEAPPAEVPTKVEEKAPPAKMPPAVPKIAPEAAPPRAPPSVPPVPKPPSPPAAPPVPAPTPALPPEPTTVADEIAGLGELAKIEEKPSVSALKVEMLKELKRLKKLMTGAEG